MGRLGGAAVFYTFPGYRPSRYKIPYRLIVWGVLKMRDIKGYEGLYAITVNGKVWSYHRKKYLNTSYVGGYEKVVLCKNSNVKTYYIHRLVAEAYIPNPDNKAHINHKDENKQNNFVGNLEWTTAKENCNYGKRNDIISNKRSKMVYCVELNKVFISATQAAKELNLNDGNINKCCKGINKTTGGYHWRYANDNDKI